MRRDWRRSVVWLTGAVAFVLAYEVMLAALKVSFLDNVGYTMLLGISGFAATMAGGAGAILFYDRKRSRRRKE